MKIIRENIFLIKAIMLIWTCFVFVCVNARAQDVGTDTTVIADTSITIDESDTDNGHPDYFEHRTGFADTIQLREVPGSVVDSLKKEDAFWYADHVFEKKQPKEKKIRTGEAPLQWLNMTTLLVIVILFLGILAWYLWQNNILARKSRIVAHDQGEEIISVNIFDINYQKEIEKAINNSDYRLAIRLMFLRLLKQLSQKKIIDYKQERTNFDYLSQLYTTGYYNDFFRLTRNYEYAWYGKFNVSAETFRIIQHQFENFDRKLS